MVRIIIKIIVFFFYCVSEGRPGAILNWNIFSAEEKGRKGMNEIGYLYNIRHYLKGFEYVFVRNKKTGT